MSELQLTVLQASTKGTSDASDPSSLRWQAGLGTTSDESLDSEDQRRSRGQRSSTHSQASGTARTPPGSELEALPDSDGQASVHGSLDLGAPQQQHGSDATLSLPPSGQRRRSLDPRVRASIPTKSSSGALSDPLAGPSQSRAASAELPRAAWSPQSAAAAQGAGQGTQTPARRSDSGALAGEAAEQVRQASQEGSRVGQPQPLPPSKGSGEAFSVRANSNWLIRFEELCFSRLVGHGSVGHVYAGLWQETQVAIKVLGDVMLPDAAFEPAAALTETTLWQDQPVTENSELLRGLQREAGIHAAMRHPNIVLWMGICLKPPLLVMEWCSRGSLYSILQTASKDAGLAAQLTWPRRLAMALDAARGMLQLHTHNPVIQHRDLKSPNLVVDRNWVTKVTDFGLSRLYSKDKTYSGSSTVINPRWLAPEVITGQEPSTAADIFSFGVVLWELCTWQSPWGEEAPFAIMTQIANGKRLPLPDLADTPGGSMPSAADLTQLIHRCWAHEPAERPRFEEVFSSLRAMGGPPSSKPSPAA